VSWQGLLVEEPLDGGVLDTSLFPELFDVVSVGLIPGADKDQPVKVGGSAGLECEFGLEVDRARGDGALDRSDDL
jgi:hypothetical protein